MVSHKRHGYCYFTKTSHNLFANLTDYFGNTLKKSYNRWSKFDFYDESCTYEMKTRKNKSNFKE